MLDALKQEFQVPEYLLRILGDYRNDPFLLYDSDDGPENKKLTAGATQGSILGTDMWNVFYDGTLREEMPEGIHLIEFADNIAVVIVAPTVFQVEVLLDGGPRP